MKRLDALSISTDLLELHEHICDLINVEYPVLQLHSDGKRNWIYLWCDATKTGTNRWLIFPTSRASLVRYLLRQATVLMLIREADQLYIVDSNEAPSRPGEKRHLRRHLYRLASLEPVKEYLPAEDSYFDEGLTNDLDLSRELTPTTYALPIAGTWFGQDFQNLFKRYERLYAFFYATRPRLVRTINSSLATLMRAPWTGGFSRVNLYSRLARQIPALHSLKVEKIQYASPGQVKFEALSSIGESIERSTRLLILNEATVSASTKLIQKTLTEAGLNKRDLSSVSNSEVALGPERRANLNGACEIIGRVLDVQEEFTTLQDHAPNIVVYAKAVTSLVRQLKRLAEFEREDMLDFDRSKSSVAEK